MSTWGKEVSKVLILGIVLGPVLDLSAGQLSDVQASNVVGGDNPTLILQSAGMSQDLVAQYSQLYLTMIEQQRYVDHAQALQTAFNNYQKSYQSLASINGQSVTPALVENVMQQATVLMAALLRYLNIPGMARIASGLIDPVTGQNLVTTNLPAGQTLDDYTVNLFVKIFTNLYQKYQVASQAGAGNKNNTGSGSQTSGPGSKSGAQTSEGGIGSDTKSENIGNQTGAGSKTGSGSQSSAQSGPSTSNLSGAGGQSTSSTHNVTGSILTAWEIVGYVLAGSVAAASVAAAGIYILNRVNGGLSAPEALVATEQIAQEFQASILDQVPVSLGTSAVTLESLQALGLPTLKSNLAGDVIEYLQIDQGLKLSNQTVDQIFALVEQPNATIESIVQQLGLQDSLVQEVTSQAQKLLTAGAVAPAMGGGASTGGVELTAQEMEGLEDLTKAQDLSALKASMAGEDSAAESAALGVDLKNARLNLAQVDSVDGADSIVASEAEAELQAVEELEGLAK